MFLRRIYIHIDKKCDTHKQPAIQTLPLLKVLLLRQYNIVFMLNLLQPNKVHLDKYKFNKGEITIT